jgi:uncharacterized C2H2 Zn-finger protein
MPETKKCEVCDQEIGASETTCPKCGTIFAELEDEVKVVTRAQIVAEKRRKAAIPPKLEPEAKPARKSVFRSLAGK